MNNNISASTQLLERPAEEAVFEIVVYGALMSASCFCGDSPIFTNAPELAPRGSVVRRLVELGPWLEAHTLCPDPAERPVPARDDWGSMVVASVEQWRGKKLQCPCGWVGWSCFGQAADHRAKCPEAS